jgi:trehalose 6-phosphate synthase/phosphatase
MGATEDVEAAIEQARRTRALRFLFDYDGTLVQLAAAPELAAPDAELLRLLERLTSVRDISIDLVSGRPREVLDQWFGHLHLLLWAEHALWRREAPHGAWRPTADVNPELLEHVVPLLERFARTTSGARLERKSASVAWHYRGVEEAVGNERASELRGLLAEALESLPLEILDGKKVIEVRFRGSSKAVVAKWIAAESAAETTIVAFGDDRTDEDLFRALPASSIIVAVGQALDGATYQLNDPAEVRLILRNLVRDSTGYAG